MEDLIKPSFQTRPYRPNEVCRIRERYQQYIWLKEKVMPYDIYESNGDVIMIFPKNEETKELYRKWRNREFSYEEVCGNK